jgi:peptidoglycan/LPS O-acetylase OafA/YrhL
MAVVEQVAQRPPTRPTPTGTPRRLPHLPGLDGVRAIAVVAVLLYHLGLPWARGGFLGVDVFLVLSGFLVGTLVLDEVESTGGFRTGRFLVRRVRRLVPALLVLLVAVAGAGLVVRDTLTTLRGDLLAALTYTTNWWQVAADRTYFELTGRPPLLQHLWTLAVEGQFYLVMPLFALLLLRVGRVRAGRVAAVLALVSALWMAVLALRGGMPVPQDPTRVYVGTDTRAAGLLLGVAAATVWRPWRTWTSGVTWRTERGDPVRRFEAGVADVLGAVALVGVLACVVLVDEYSTTLYRGGFLAFAALALVLVGAAADPAGMLGRALGRQPLRWLGERSYAIYLWHWPVLTLLRPEQDLSLPGPLEDALRVAVTLVLAEASYRWVEQPVRRGALGRLVRRARTPGPQRRRALVGAAGGVTAAVLLVGTLGVAVARTPAAPTGAASVIGAAVPAQDVTPPPDPAQQPAPDATPAPDAAAPAAQPTAPAPPPEEVGTVSAYGDSVMLGAAAELAAHGVPADAAVSRQMGTMTDLVLDAAAAGTLGHTVVVHGGTNGPVAEDDLRRLLDATRDRRVFVVNVRVPRPWEQYDNELFARVVAEYPHAHLLDWKAQGDAHPEWFYDDGIHLRENGGRQGYADWLWQEIQPRG